jgi:hypothetical protein
MEYREVVQRDRAEIEILLRSTDKTDILDALLSAAYTSVLHHLAPARLQP